jgi:menaquinone-dependent protoporphyrinogen oxidase
MEVDMDVLVAVATRHGATAGIGEAIAEVIRSQGHVADVRPADAVLSLDGYDAVVLGSGVYAGRWLGPAKEFAERFESELRERRVWLFSSGPLGEPPKPEANPVDVEALLARTHAREHRVFAGKLDRRALGVAERAIVTVVRAPDGDFRSWPEIGDWARQIGESITAVGSGRA